MPIFRKSSKKKNVEKQKQDLEYLFDTLSSELVDVEKKYDDVCYQIEFFGSTPELEKEKTDCEMMLAWLQSEFDEIKKSLFQLQTQTLA